MTKQKLEKAIAAEIAYTKQQFLEQQQRSPQELRKEGLLLYPLQFLNAQESNQSTRIQLACSFVINDTYFKRGSLVKLQAGNSTYTCRILDLEAQTITISSDADLDENLNDVDLHLQHIPDDRTLQCLTLGWKLSNTLPHLLEFEADFKKEKEVIRWDHPSLNPSQQQAVGSILAKNPTVVIQGPPGTGKTHMLSIAIAALVKSGKRIIVSAPSNTAVDQLSRQVIDQGCQLLRLGNDEKISADLLDYTLDGYLEKGPSSRSIQHLKKQLNQAETLANRHIRNFTKEAADERRNARKEVREIKQLMRKIAKDAVAQLIETSQVIASTPVGLFNHLSKDFTVDVVVLDEAGQALEPLAWLAASFGKRLVLCGDPQQLPPTVLSPEAEKLGLGMSLLERVTTQYPPILLNEQYRMRKPIGPIVSKLFYQDALQSNTTANDGSFIFIDTAGYDAPESHDETTGSISNPGEISLLKLLVEEYGLSQSNSVIITPYNAQLNLIKKAFPSWHVSTIDAIQGQEKEHVIVSMVRSNENGIIGFLSDQRRTNVAISRAKTQCILIGDSSTLASQPFYTQFLDCAETMGTYRSAWEFVTS